MAALLGEWAAALELDRCVTTLGLKGALVNGTIDGLFLDHAVFALSVHFAQTYGGMRLAPFTVRGGLALIPWVALRYPIKKITALVTLVVLFCYLMSDGRPLYINRLEMERGV